MKRICLFFIFVLNYLSINAQTAPDTFIIQTNIGTMKGILYADMPNHVKAFKERANAGKFNGTLFTRVINGFMIQGGSPDSRNAAPGARCGYGDRSAEIMPENRTLHFHKKGALASPRQNDDINPKKKSDTSQFYIVQGRTYRSGELDTLELIKNIPIRKKAIAKYYTPIRPEMLKIDRKGMFEALAAENVCCNVHYIPTYYFPYYQKLGYRKGLCPKAEKLYEEILSLPLYYAMSDQDVEDVIEAVRRICAYYAK